MKNNLHEKPLPDPDAADEADLDEEEDRGKRGKRGGRRKSK